MKKSILILIVAIFIGQSSFSQGLSESVKKKFTIGADFFTDIWYGVPDGVDTRTINQGATVFGMLNFPLGEGMTSFSIGLGIRNHNMYSDSRIMDVKADTITFTQIHDGVSYRRSKVNLVYLDLPVEFKIRFNSGFKVTVGFKAGWNIDSKTKYYGDDFDAPIGRKVKSKSIRHLESFSYGPTLRIGYKFVSLYSYYQISDAFTRNLGPELRPFSIGLTITPF